MGLVESVATLRETLAEFPELRAYEPLGLLVQGLAEKFDAGKLQAVEVQQLRQGLKELREGLELVQPQKGGNVAAAFALLQEEMGEAHAGKPGG